MSNAKYIIFILYKTCSSRAYTKLITVQPLYLAGKGAGGGGGGEDSCYIQPGFQESGTGTNLVQCQWVEVHSGGGLWGLGQSTSWLKTHSTFCLVCVVVSVVLAIALGGGKVRGEGGRGRGVTLFSVAHAVWHCVTSVVVSNVVFHRDTKSVSLLDLIRRPCFGGVGKVSAGTSFSTILYTWNLKVRRRTLFAPLLGSWEVKR